jgi:hypothetical protein
MKDIDDSLSQHSSLRQSAIGSFAFTGVGTAFVDVDNDDKDSYKNLTQDRQLEPFSNHDDDSFGHVGESFNLLSSKRHVKFE